MNNRTPQYLDSFYRANNSSDEAQFVTRETIKTQCTLNTSLIQTIPDLQTPSRDCLPNATVFLHNTPPANNLDSLKIEAKIATIKGCIQYELSTLNKTFFILGFIAGSHQYGIPNKSYKILQQNIDILQKEHSTTNDFIKTLMETQASIFDKITNTTSFFSETILHPEPVNNFSITRENAELNDRCNQTSNSTQKRNHLYAEKNVKPTEKNDKQTDCDTAHCPSIQQPKESVAQKNIYIYIYVYVYV